MDQEPDNKQVEEQSSLETLETPSEAAVPPTPGQAVEPQTTPEPQVSQPAENENEPGPKKSLINRLLYKIKSFNIYLLLFIFIIVLAGLITFAAYQKSKQSEQKGPAVSSQDINQDVLKQLRNSNVSVGEPKQILSVEANAVFSGSVLIRGDFESAGQIKSEGNITTPGLNVAGTGTLQTLQSGKLQISGDSQLQGNLSVQKSLSVSGSGNFGGTLTASKLNVQSLELAGNLVISSHIASSGGTPSKSSGNALGSGGTASISGSDTAGTITINTGGSPHAGCFISVGFTKSFSSTPHVVVAPIGSSAAAINYYVTRSSSGFSLCTTSSAPSSRNFAFDYIVIN
jgi:cytoskeletal protein CcmA (bactofilin family)